MQAPPASVTGLLIDRPDNLHFPSAYLLPVLSALLAAGTPCQTLGYRLRLQEKFNTSSACAHSTSVRHLQVHSTRTCLEWTLWV